MSLFYAEATPMLKTLSDATTKFVSEVSVVWNVTLYVVTLPVSSQGDLSRPHDVAVFCASSVRVH